MLRATLDVGCLGTAVTTSAALICALNQSKMKGSYFALHPMLAACGFSVVASASYMMARESRRTSTTVKIHQASMFIGTGSIYYALWVIYGVKTMNKKKHIQTTHSYWGLGAAIMLTMLSVGTSLAVRNESMSPKEKAVAMRRHKFAGKVAGLFLTAAVVTGTMSTFKEPKTRLLVAGSAVASMLLVITAAVTK